MKQKLSTKRGKYKNAMGHNTFIAVRLKETQHSDLLAIAVAQASSISQVVRTLIVRGVMAVEFHFSPDPVRAEAVFFGRREEADACVAMLARFARLKPESSEWHFDLTLTERWGRRIYCTKEFAAFFHAQRGNTVPEGLKFTVEVDSRQSPAYRTAFAAGWLVRQKRGAGAWTKEHLAEDLVHA